MMGVLLERGAVFSGTVQRNAPRLTHPHHLQSHPFQVVQEVSTRNTRILWGWSRKKNVFYKFYKILPGQTKSHQVAPENCTIQGRPTQHITSQIPKSSQSSCESTFYKHFPVYPGFITVETDSERTLCLQAEINASRLTRPHHLPNPAPSRWCKKLIQKTQLYLRPTWQKHHLNSSSYKLCIYTFP